MTMKLRLPLALGVFGLLVGCGARDEFKHETVEAYQADNSLRQDVLQKCADHITGKIAFSTSADTDECRKALAADQNIRSAAHEAKEQAASRAALSAAARQFEGK
jgi:hypothetical protein